MKRIDLPHLSAFSLILGASSIPGVFAQTNQSQSPNYTSSQSSQVAPQSNVMGQTNESSSPSATQHSTPAQLVEALHTAFGNNHSRAVHAKGIILEGTFTPDPAASSLTIATHLQHTVSKVILRFSDFTGIPTIPDNSESANPRGLSVRFILPDGEMTDIVGHSFNGFPTKTSDEFRELLLAIGASGSQAPKPNALDLFLNTHPIAKTFLTTQKSPESFSSISYFGVNSFKFTNSQGHSHFIRYQFLPLEGERLLNSAQLKGQDKNYLMDEITSRVAKKTIRFSLVAQLAETGDLVEDPSVAFPDNRKTVVLGTIELTKLSSNTEAQDKELAFSPINLPAGIAPADPMISFRGKAYPVSVKERQ